MNSNKEAKGLTFRRGSEVVQVERSVNVCQYYSSGLLHQDGGRVNGFRTSGYGLFLGSNSEFGLSVIQP